MANIKNLRTIRLSHDEAVKNGRAGGIKSGMCRRRKKELRELLSDFLDSPSSPELSNYLEEWGIPESDRTNLAAIVIHVFDKAVNRGDIAACKTILEWGGQLTYQLESQEFEDSNSNGTFTEEKNQRSNVIIYDPATPPDELLRKKES